ncbi:hypothetical protein [Mariprofundus ferrooxydans]|uniref:hypothetical protein n=1 Tax=Mariprofundus ferrooxydans TaxID=314344 RepID=UPI001F0E169E|nr:hypothetical protein [Mariprofundus ferrooxydans]
MSSPGNRLGATLLLLLVSALFYGASFVKVPAIDHIADTYFSESIRSATLAYATIRGVNAVVSVVKESHLELAPAGVGITIAAGQILDPIDDMTERLSSVLVAAIASLGIQKLGYEIGTAISFKAIAIVLLLMVPLLWLNSATLTTLYGPLLKLCLLLLLLRFLLPASALVSDQLYSHWLQPGIADAVDDLSVVSSSYQSLSKLSPEQDGGFFSSMTTATSEKVEQIRAAFMQMVEHAENIIRSLLTLMTLYLAIFVVQVVLLPMLMLWLMLRIGKSRMLDVLADSFRHKLTDSHDDAAL